ncbi:MAG TPA: bifunctional DNA primase/polymerase, partial [Catenuloplanes sp.]
DREGCACLTCHGFYAATRDPARIRAMVDRHRTGLLAIRTGAPSGLVVIDVDPGNGGYDTLAALDAERLLPGTLMVETGTGGLHLFYAHPGAPVKSAAGLLGPGVDIKADGGYVVAAPSRHPRSGRPYRWIDGRHDHRPTALHPRLTVRLLKDPPPPPRPLAAPASPGTVGAFTAPSDPAGRLAGLLRVVMEAPQGQRNATLNWAAYKAAELIRDRDAPRGSVVSALTEAATHAGLRPGEIRATIASGLRAGNVS